MSRPPAASSLPSPSPSPAPAPAPDADQRPRCAWATSDPLYRRYHDEEWGVPLRDERGLYEMLVLEGAQAGLSWITILRKRERYRQLFKGFDPEQVAAFGKGDVERLLADPGIVRNRLKVESAVANALRVVALRAEPGGFAGLVWSFAVGRPRRGGWQRQGDVPAETAESQAMSRTLKRRGFGFVGPTICYAFMQATGMVNDHLAGCFRQREVAAAGTVRR